MIKTNGNRRPKAILVKKSVSKAMLDNLRSFVKDIKSSSIIDPSFEKKTGLTSAEALLIINKKEEKAGIAFTLVSSIKNGVCDVSIFVVEEKAIRSISRKWGEKSDEVEIEPTFYFNDGAVVNKKARMYVKDGKVVILTHKDEIAIFEKESKDAVFVAEVDVKENKNGIVTVDVEADYHSSADHAKKLNAMIEEQFIHIKGVDRSSSKSDVIKVYDTKTKKFKTKNFMVSEDIGHLRNGIYKVKDNGVEKRLAVESDSFGVEVMLYLFDIRDEPVKGKEVKSFK